MINVSHRIRIFAAPEFRSVLNTQFNKFHIQNIEMMCDSFANRISKNKRIDKDFAGEDMLFYIYLLYTKIYAKHGINKGKMLSIE